MYSDLKQPYGVLDDMSVVEVVWMLEGNLENKKDYYEMVSYAVKNAMVSVHQGKDMKLFGGSEEADSQRITEEQRNEDLNHLENTFGGL